MKFTLYFNNILLNFARKICRFELVPKNFGMMNVVIFLLRLS